MNTENIIYNMLTENTGKHMLDSGMSSNRNWQRNQLKTIEDFRNEEYFKWDKDWGGTLSVFHHLNESLDYNKEYTEELYKYLDEMNAHYNDTEFVAKFMEVKFDGKANIENTYNVDSILSQVLLLCWVDDLHDNDHVALSIHGGADVRGGYTDFKIFDWDVDTFFNFHPEYWEDQETLQCYLSEEQYKEYCKNLDD